MRTIKLLFLICFSLLSVTAFANNKGKNFDRVFFIIFENTDLKDAMDQPFFKKLANEGVNFTQLLAITHPSQPNYIALTSGDLHGVRSNSSVNLNVRNIADLLEAQGHSWKVYAEDFPGNCYTGSQRGNYYRKHNPFISYLSIQKNPQRCANIVSSQELLK
ncbi:MAG: alkaline phosphatase family protein, partial [Oligoflexia bacterium]|nr:alkaline phosphatase family protein [Oligoflexia bacterium]